jgi:hypothetical protein
MEDVLVADIDEALELLRELTVQVKEGICICMSAQQLMACLAKHQTKGQSLDANPQQSRRCLSHVVP